MCALLKNRSSGQFVCNICLNDIQKDKVPKRSKKSKFSFANFPRYLIEKLKTVCKYKQADFPGDTNLDQEIRETQALQLNRLESYLLKLVIPFIRIVHCPRGSYFKVKGDLILISSDISHSFSKILPVDQTLIPVCFKRKLSYSGSYVEEFVDKSKLKMYFSWFKKYNHLYRDIELDSSLIELFKDDSLAASKDFERLTKQEEEQSLESKDESEDELMDEVDIADDIEFFTSQDLVEPCIQDGKEFTRDQTTMFLNKYCEDTNIPSVANRLADTIVEYELNQGTSFRPRDDHEVDDEIISEEEFLKNIEEEVVVHEVDDEIISEEEFLKNIEEQIIVQEQDAVTLPHRVSHDEITNEIDVVMNPTEEQSSTVANSAKK